VLLATLLGTINGAGAALARVIQAYVDKENGGATEETSAAE
jgi:large subunit ribosomal protein L10